MGIDCFSIEYELKNKINSFWDEEELSELGGDLYDLLYEFLTDIFTRKAEADYLENLDAYMSGGCAYDLDIKKDELYFCIKDYAWIYAKIGIHWFELASIICRQEIDNVLNKYNLQLSKQEISLSLKNLTNNYDTYDRTLLIVIKDELYLIDKEEKTVSPDEEGGQTMPILSEEEKETILKIIESKECQCQLCEKIRAGNFAAIAP